MIQSGDCSIASVMPDGSLLLEQGGRRHHARIHGIDVPQPTPPLYVEIVGERVGGASSPLRCEVVHGGSPASVRLRHLAWHDKSGEVWRDLASTLLGQGLAVTCAGRGRPPPRGWAPALTAVPAGGLPASAAVRPAPGRRGP